MPSDDRTNRALEAVSGPARAFRSAVARSVDEVRGLLRDRRAAGATAGADELGAFAAGRIDAERFEALSSGSSPLEPAAAARMERALDVLARVDAEGDDVFRLEVEEGGDVRAAVAAGLARAGRAFGAARCVELARTGRYRPEVHDGYTEAFPPWRWNRGEREMAPPLVVRLAGADLRAGALADLLDGGQKLVLVAEGRVAPAPLVRLVTPGVLVIQADVPEELDRLSGFDGPGVALYAEASAGAARFVHDPEAGDAPARRLTVGDLPEDGALRPLGSLTARQQAEELEQLVALATPAAARGAPSANGAGEGADDVEPADRLAAWLLRQADL